MHCAFAVRWKMNTQLLKVHIIMTKIGKNRLENSSLHNKKWLYDRQA